MSGDPAAPAIARPIKRDRDALEPDPKEPPARDLFWDTEPLEKCTYNIFRPQTSEIYVSRDFEDYPKFIDFLDGFAKTIGEGASSVSLEQPKKVVQHIMCEQVAKIDMLQILRRTLLLLDQSAGAAPLLQSLNDKMEPIDMPICQPFIVTYDNKKRTVDSLDRLDFFRLDRNLKGKKMPNEKKNFDAQIFESSEQAKECFENSRRYFEYLNRPIVPTDIDMTDMCKFSTHVPDVNDIIFLLLCDPQTLFPGPGSRSRAESYSPQPKKRARNKNAAENGAVSSNAGASATTSNSRTKYIEQVYSNMKYKKKIYKTPSVGSIAYSNGRLVVTWVNFINWFISKLTIISN